MSETSTRKSRKGVPLKDPEVALKERVTVKMTRGDRRGLGWLIDRRLAAIEQATGGTAGVTITEAAYLRDLLVRELRAEGWTGEETEDAQAPPPKPARAKPKRP